MYRREAHPDVPSAPNPKYRSVDKNPDQQITSDQVIQEDESRDQEDLHDSDQKYRNNTSLPKKATHKDLYKNSDDAALISSSSSSNSASLSSSSDESASRSGTSKRILSDEDREIFIQHGMVDNTFTYLGGGCFGQVI